MWNKACRMLLAICCGVMAILNFGSNDCLIFVTLGTILIKGDWD
jgi:hypothetical protein